MIFFLLNLGVLLSSFAESTKMDSALLDHDTRVTAWAEWRLNAMEQFTMHEHIHWSLLVLQGILIITWQEL